MASANEPSEDFFHLPIPREVWHYTTLPGLAGIVSSATVWATEARHTKDASELIHAREVALNFLKALTPTNPHDESARNSGLKLVQNAFDQGVLSPERSEIYLASFSEEADSKSQWMEFADAGKGVSLGFDLRNIRPPKDLDLAITFAPCVYQTKDKEALLEFALRSFIQVAATLHKQTLDNPWMVARLKDLALIERIYGNHLQGEALVPALQDGFSESIRKAADRASFDLLRAASHCKDLSFQQEKEWRLALPRLKSKPLEQVEVCYRENAVPYIASRLFQDFTRLPLTRVITGPCCVQQGNVQEILRSAGYDIPILVSGIPLRKVVSK